MPRQIGNFRPGQLRQATSWTGLTENTHFHNAFSFKPQYLNKVLRFLVDVNMGTSFTRWLDQFSVAYIDTPDQPFKWRLKGYNDKVVRLLGAFQDEAMTVPISPALGGTLTTPGQYGAAIYLLFPESRFSITQHLIGEHPDTWQLRVQNDPIQVANGWLYKCVNVTSDPEDFVSPAELDKGTRWSSQGGSVEAYGSERGQTISFTTPFEMEERITQFRFEQKVHGATIDMGKNGAFMFDLQDEDGGTHTYWLSYMEWELIRQFYLKQAEIIFYGKSTVDNQGVTNLYSENGNPITSGRGIREQFLPTNRHYYSTMSLDYLTDVALDAVIGKVDPGNRTFVIGTGERGLMELHKMLQRELKTTDYKWLGDTTGRAYNWTGGNANNEMTLRLGQFMAVAVINGINFKFMWMPHYDDPIRNKLQHPKGGYAESHRMTIMDFGSKNEPNIRKIRVNGLEPIYRYIPGLRHPYIKGGTVASNRPEMVANSFDGYELHLMDWVGAVVLDPTRVIEFVPNILKGN